MRLKQHREDIKELRSAGHIGIAIRLHNLILWAEAVLAPVQYANVAEMLHRERRVIKDAEGK